MLVVAAPEISGVRAAVLEAADPVQRRDPRDGLRAQLDARRAGVVVRPHRSDRVGCDVAVQPDDLVGGQRQVGAGAEQQGVGAGRVVGVLQDCLRGERADARHEGHAAVDGLGGRVHDRASLRAVEVGEASRRPEDSDPVDAGGHRPVDEDAERLGPDAAVGGTWCGQVGDKRSEHARRLRRPPQPVPAVLLRRVPPGYVSCSPSGLVITTLS